ncbi:MAG: hypothetical protein ACM3US_06995 [Sphingomonadaceae bacterium]
MKERHLRAAWFALFASVGLILGGFIIGYGTALLGGPEAEPTRAVSALPTLASTPTPGTAFATSVDHAGGEGADGRAEPSAAPAEEMPGPTSTPPPASRGSFPQEQSVGAGLSLSLDNVDVNREQGGVEVVLLLSNRSSRGVVFSFSPATDLSVVDGQGRRFELRWVEFDGIVKLDPQQGTRLARAYFAGPLDQDSRYLTVKAGHPPQLPEVSWQIPLSQ